MNGNAEKKERISLIRKVDLFAIGAVITWGVMVFFLWVGIAHGQTAASQPVVATTGGGAKVWLLANLWWLVPLSINVLSSVATALKNYPKAEGAAKVIWLIVGFLGNVEFKDGKKPGFAIKTPLTMPSPPPTPRPADGGATTPPVPPDVAKPADDASKKG